MARDNPALGWIAVAVVILAFAVATRTTADPDLWGHLRLGLDTLHTRGLTAEDPYSFTQDRPWINHEWLSEVQIAIAYRAAGVAGLALLKGALTIAALALVWTAFRGADVIARMIVMGVVVVGTGSITPTLRPQLWSLVLVVVLCRVLRSDRPGARRWLPVLFTIWANLHGGWIVGLGILGVWAAADVWTAPRGLVAWTVVVLASIAATLVTPYGLTLWEFLASTVRTTRAISEWQPLFARPLFNWLPCVVAFFAALWAMRRPFPHRIPVACVLALLAYASFRVSRVGPLFVEAAAVLLAPAIVASLPLRPLSRSRTSAREELAVASVIVVAAIGAAGWLASSSLRCVAIPRETWVPPTQGVRLLAGSAGPGRVVTFFDWGQYAIWWLGPRLRVSMDGRRETVYSDARLAEHDAILAGAPEGLLALDSWRAEYVWLPARSRSAKEWLRGHGYRIEYEDAAEFVAVRSDLRPLPPAPAMPSGPRCFPE